MFSRSRPVSTSDLISEARRRGVVPRPPTFSELYHRGDLVSVIPAHKPGLRSHRSVAYSLPVNGRCSNPGHREHGQHVGGSLPWQSCNELTSAKDTDDSGSHE